MTKLQSNQRVIKRILCFILGHDWEFVLENEMDVFCSRCKRQATKRRNS